MQQKNGKYNQIASLDYYTEGPAIDRLGNIYFTSLRGGVIYKYDTHHQLTAWAASPCPNGQLIIANDDHLVCDVAAASIRKYDAEGRFTGNLVEGKCGGITVECPNDLAADDAGNIYFSDSVRFNGKVFCISGDGRERLIKGGLDYPNGLAVSKDAQCLFVAESYKNRVLKIDLSTGELLDRIMLPEHDSGILEKNLPDGLTVDVEGNIWVAHYGMRALHKISSDGILKETIDTSLPLTSNLIFINNNTIVVTGGTGEPGPGSVIKIELS